MRINAKGQVTIPKRVREAAGLLPETEVEFFVNDGTVRIVKVPSGEQGRGELLVERLRRNAGHITMTTDEIMALTRGAD